MIPGLDMFTTLGSLRRYTAQVRVPLTPLAWSPLRSAFGNKP